MKKVHLVVALLLTACGDGVGPDDVRVAGSSEALSTVSQTGEVGEELAEPLSIRVLDADGEPMADHNVSWVVTSGGGSVSGGSKTNQSGVAQQIWTLGTAPGEHSLEARVAGLPAIEFTASAVAGSAADVVIDPEEVFFDLPFDSLLLAAAVVDRFGNELTSTDITWTSSDADVISVDSDGWIHAEGGGEATVTASTGSLGASIPVEVDRPLFTSPFVDLDLAVDFLAFGVPFAGANDNGTYEIQLNGDSMAVYSVTTGVVDRVAAQEDSQDFEVSVVYSESWVVIYDHLVDPRVEVGDAVVAGDTLGLVANFGNIQVGDELVPTGRIELQVNYQADRDPDSVWCPALFGTAEFNAAHSAALLRTNGETATCLKPKIY